MNLWRTAAGKSVRKTETRFPQTFYFRLGRNSREFRWYEIRVIRCNCHWVKCFPSSVPGVPGGNYKEDVQGCSFVLSHPWRHDAERDRISFSILENDFSCSLHSYMVFHTRNTREGIVFPDDLNGEENLTHPQVPQHYLRSRCFLSFLSVQFCKQDIKVNLWIIILLSRIYVNNYCASCFHCIL